jgi:alpha-tubulin suppressor-like RCC1 family protein
MPHFSDCAKQVACGDYHTLVLSISGLVYACGKGDRGQLGLNSTENHDMLQIVESISKATIK